MTNYLVAGCLGVMWLCSVIFLPGIRRSPINNMIALALVAGSGSLSMGQPGMRNAFVMLTGQHWVAFALEMDFALITMAAVLSWLSLSRSHGRRRDVRRRLWLTWSQTVLVGLIVTACAALNDLGAEASYAAIGHGQATSAQVVTIGVYETSMIFTFTQVAIMFGRVARASASRWTRYSLYVVCLSAFGSQGRSIYTLIYLLGYDVGDLPAWSFELAASINAPSHAVGCIGLIVHVLGGARTGLNARRRLRTLASLWHPLRDAYYPLVVRVHERLPHGPQLVVAVTEIHDAMARLSGWPGSPQLLRQAREAAVAAGTPAERVDAAAHAAWLATAIQHDIDLSNVKHTPWTYGGAVDDSLAAGVEWLCRIAREMPSPFVRSFVGSDPLKGITSCEIATASTDPPLSRPTI